MRDSPCYQLNGFVGKERDMDVDSPISVSCQDYEGLVNEREEMAQEELKGTNLNALC